MFLLLLYKVQIIFFNLKLLFKKSKFNLKEDSLQKIANELERVKGISQAKSKEVNCSLFLNLLKLDLFL